MGLQEPLLFLLHGINNKYNTAYAKAVKANAARL